MGCESTHQLGDCWICLKKHHQGGFIQTTCQALDAKEWDHAVACNTTSIRRLNFWSADLGEVRIKGAGYDVEPNNSTVVKGMNAGRLLYEPMHGGYGAVVALGQNYSLQGLLSQTCETYSQASSLAESSSVPVLRCFG